MYYTRQSTQRKETDCSLTVQDSPYRVRGRLGGICIG